MTLAEFVYIEAKRGKKNLTLKDVIDQLRHLVSILESASSGGTDALEGYRLPQQIIQSDPGRPWDFSPPSVRGMKTDLMARKSLTKLGDIMEPTQGVTPGGNSLDIFLVRSGVDCEPELLIPVVEAEDIKSWTVEKTDKRLIYPYDSSGSPSALGELPDDLTPDQALRSIEAQIASGTVRFPKTATYLAHFYERLSSRVAEKKPFSAYGKNWFEYHRPRDPKVMRSFPKIMTRRMTKNVEFSLDRTGIVPTDGCITLSLKGTSKWVHRVRELGATDDKTYLFLLGILNSSVVKFLLKSRQDSWQGGFYQVPEDFLQSIPIPNISRRSLSRFLALTQLVETATSGLGDQESVDVQVSELYGLQKALASMRTFLSSR